jgi:hypothetical protein
MKVVAVALDLAAFGLGLLAAWYWLKASQVIVRDPFPQDGISRATSPGDFLFPTIDAFQESAAWNKVAARFTAGAVLLGTLGNLAAEWPL